MYGAVAPGLAVSTVAPGLAVSSSEFLQTLGSAVASVPQPQEPVTPAVPDAPVTPAVPDPGTPGQPEEPARVPTPEEPVTPAVPEPGPGEPNPGHEPAPTESIGSGPRPRSPKESRQEKELGEASFVATPFRGA